MGINAVTAQISKAVTSTTVGVGSMQNGGTTRRLLLTEFICGSDAATLGTANFRWQIQRSTTGATGTTVTAAATNYLDGHTLDISEIGVFSSGGIISNLTANGTLTANAILLTIALAEPATFRWVANPGFEIVVPATTNAGLHFLTPVCGGTPSVAAQITCEDR